MRSNKKAGRGSEREQVVQHLLDEACPSGQSLEVQEVRPLANLWSGYGTVLAAQVVDEEGKRHSYVVKQVAPPAGSGVGHTRKLHSYQVEAFFYEKLAPEIHQLGADCHLPRALVVHNQLDSGGGGSMEMLLTDLRPRFPSPASSGMDAAHARAALTWLAAFHAVFWERPTPPEVWQEGCYWHLETRHEELEAMDWKELQGAAPELDRRLRSSEHRTLVHGDFKAANLHFGKDAQGQPLCAAYDFQYLGGGVGAKDLVYLLCSSVQAAVVQRQEAELLDHYHSQLAARLPADAAARYTRAVLQEHYDLATLDYVRFMDGWGYWGCCSSMLRTRARALLPQLELA